MGRLRRVVPILIVMLALGMASAATLPAAAAAKGKGTTIAPPGNSGVSQYVEDVPTAKGGKPSSSIVVPPATGGGSGSGGSGSGGSGSGPSGDSTGGSGSSGAGGSSAGAPPTLTKAVTRKLDHSGEAGRSAAALADATAPVVSRQKPAPSKRPVAATTAVFKSLEGSAGGGGMGSFLPIFLIVTLLLVSALGIFARRRAA